MLTRQEENVLLTVLKLADNAYIVSIKDYLEKFTDKKFSFGALHVSLKKLDRNGYVETVKGASESVRGGRSKKYYRITSDGIAALQREKKVQELLWSNFNELAKNIPE